ncbi:mitochondrial ribosomal protein L27-domain-containing protein [Dipodascopsis uninucleata]
MRASTIRLLEHFRDRMLPARNRVRYTKRVPLGSKNGNKDYYKGTGSAGNGWHTKRGRYIIDFQKVRTYVVPKQLATTNLKPFVSNKLPEVINKFPGFPHGGADANWYIQKYREYLIYGRSLAPRMKRSKDYVENP